MDYESGIFVASLFLGLVSGLLKRWVLKSLVLFSYKQPLEGSKIRWGVLQSKRDTKKSPLNLSTVNGNYRKFDRKFKRTRNLEYVETTQGVKAFYKEQKVWGLKIPMVGSLFSGKLAGK